MLDNAGTSGRDVDVGKMPEFNELMFRLAKWRNPEIDFKKPGRDKDQALLLLADSARVAQQLTPKVWKRFVANGA